MSYKCEILADSLSPQGHRLTTFKLTYPRIIHAELMTHRMFSRNSASSRAIPFEKMVQMVEEDPFIPIAWQKDHKGMQGTEYITAKDDIWLAKTNWLRARDYAVDYAAHNNKQVGVTKQLCNRLLEPFMWHTVIVTSGYEGLENFFGLRCPKYGNEEHGYYRSKKEALRNLQAKGVDISNLLKSTDLEWMQINKSQAEIHIQILAEMMWDAYNDNRPKRLKEGEWHIPFGDKMDDAYIQEELAEELPRFEQRYQSFIFAKVKIATARCARISYETLGKDSKIDYEADIKLHDRLLADHHMSPFEHIAQAMSEQQYHEFRKGRHEAELMDNSENEFWIIEDETGELGWCNNLRGFIPYRYIVENENTL
jgi:thymidylate synthase ThyX